MADSKLKSVVWVVLDSCRYDSFVEAPTPNLDRWAERVGARTERRFSYASWTLPSHHAFLLGLTPHPNDPAQPAAEVYENEFREWRKRLGAARLDFSDALPSLTLTRLLNKLGYQTIGRASLPVLNEWTSFAQAFDDYRLMDRHDRLDAMVEEIALEPGKPRFHLLNAGETHYPYLLENAPQISGLHGIARRLADGEDAGARHPSLSERDLERFRAQQPRCVSHADRILGDLIEHCRAPAHLIVTSDHGELFGEDGFFGHGPVMHPKAFEVPLLEGPIGEAEAERTAP
jgi:arylsulfatase A-like enzyme